MKPNRIRTFSALAATPLAALMLTLHNISQVREYAEELQNG